MIEKKFDAEKVTEKSLINPIFDILPLVGRIFLYEKYKKDINSFIVLN